MTKAAIVSTVAALATFLSLAAVLAPATPSVDARALADTALATAKDTGSTGIAEAVGRALPDGARAVVVRPGRSNEPPTRSGTHEVAVVVGEVDRAAVALLVANGGVVGSAATPDGWWAAVSVPASVAAPVGPALALLVAAALLGAAAAEVPRTVAQPNDALVRGVVDLLPHLPDDAVHRALDVLEAGGVQPIVPDGRPVDSRRHRVVGTEVTDEPARVDTVARTVRPGYADGHRVVLRPDVVAYVAGAGQDAERA